MKHSLVKTLTAMFILLAMTCGLLYVTPARAAVNPLISEILINPPGTDTPNEYIELRGDANAVLPLGTYLVGIEGDASTLGDIQDIFDLSGLSFGSNGYLVLRQSGSTYAADPNANVVTATGSGWGTGVLHSADSGTEIENASVTFLLINAASAPTLSDDIDNNNDGTADGTVYAGWAIYDGVSSLDNSAAGDFGYASPTFFNSGGGGAGPGAQSVTFTASYLGRASGNTSGSNAADWVASDLTVGTAPNYTLNTATFPSNYIGAALNHIGSSNFTILPPTFTPTNTTTATLAALPSATHSATPTNTVTATATSATTPVLINIYINEFLINPPGTDTGSEIIELRGLANSTLPANTYMVAIDGDIGSEGTLDNIFNLSGLSFGSNGFMILRQNASSYTINPNSSVYTMTGTSAANSWSSAFSTGGDLENGSMTLLLIQSATPPSLTDDIDTTNTGATNAPYTFWTIYDGIGVIDGASERAYAPINYIEQGFTSSIATGILVDASAVAGEIEYFARAANDTTGSAATDWLGANLAGTVSNMTIEGTRVTQSSYANQMIDHWGSSNFPSLQTATATHTSTPTDSPTPTITATLTMAPTETAAITPTLTDTATFTETPTPTNDATLTMTSTVIPTNTPTPTDTAILIETPTETASNTPTPTDLATVAETPTETATTIPATLIPTDTATLAPTPTESATNTPTYTAIPTDTATITPTATLTFTPTYTITATRTPTKTATKTPTKTKTPVTLVLSSIGIQDSWLLESSEVSGLGGTLNSGATTFNIGDDAAKKQYRGILSFNTSAIPDNATITSVMLKVKQQSIAGGGNPISIFQGFMIDIKSGFLGTSALQITDFQAPAGATYGPISPALISSVYTLNLTGGKAFVNKLAANSGLTQIRLRFKLDDNNNTTANYLSLYSGNATLTTDRPQLLITYTVP